MISRKRTIKRTSIFRKSSRKSSRKSRRKSRKSKSYPETLSDGYNRYAIQVPYNAKIYRSKKSLAHPLNKVKLILEGKGAKEVKLIYNKVGWKNLWKILHPFGLYYAGFSKWRRYAILEYTAKRDLGKEVAADIVKIGGPETGFFSAKNFHSVIKSKGKKGGSGKRINRKQRKRTRKINRTRRRTRY